ncbi:MAG TPA: aminotransferase class V-fold PLP-dependent enzyme [Actinomycetes bacterium]|jgi:isopenicillin-N epimerase|nr:aminotransferase class V-fold PLP-dependent enzyme [Actinomycetes bacterium]
MPAEPSTATHAEPNPLWGADWQAVRDLWPLEPTVAHLNHGSFGAVPTPVLEEQQSWRDRMESNPVRFLVREMPSALAAARGEVAAFLGAAEGSLAFVPNATTGASSVLAVFPFERDDAVLVTDHSYGAVRIAAHRFAADHGARVDTVHVPLTASDDEAVDAVLGAVHERTRLVVLDHVTSPTARRLPLAELVPAVQERGAAVLVDGAHSPGMLDVDLEALGADFFVGNLHKWCCAARGSAVLHASTRWRGSLRPLVASWGEAEGFPLAFDDTGTNDPTPWLSAPLALRVLERLGWDRLRRHNVELAVTGQQLVAAAIGVPARELPRDSAVPMQLVPLPEGLVTSREQAAALQDRIGEESAVEVAITFFDGRGYVRVCAHAYNAPADYQRLAAELPALL